MNGQMKIWIGKFVSGLHFKFLSLVVGVATLLLAAQLTTDTIAELKDIRDQRFNEAVSVTNVVARTLEKQFWNLELDDIERILASVRENTDIIQLSFVDAQKTIWLDGDIATSPIIPSEHSPLQIKAMETGKTASHVTQSRIEVAEPLKEQTGSSLMAESRVIASVMVSFENPGLWVTLVPIIKDKLFSLIPILLMGLLLAAKMVSQITAPLRGLSETAKAIADGDLERQAEGKGAREIRQLAASFNQMVATIRENIAQIYDLAYVDKITQLPNREYFKRELTRAVIKGKRTKTSGALLFVDLDGFKRVNDTFGHDFGDKLLSEFADRIGELVRQGDQISFDAAQELYEDEGEVMAKKANTFARLGGDEFTILLPEIREETDAATVARRIIESVQVPFIIDGKEIIVGTSIGIAAFPRDGQDYQTILKHADMAMYQAKDEGKNTFRYFSSELNDQASNKMEIEADLRNALVNGELELFYQPKIDTETMKVHSLEGLIRWHHPKKGMINPGEFISIAEDCGLILPLGEYVIETACKQIKTFAAAGIKIPVAVNISMQQFEKKDFSEIVLSLLKKTGADPTLLELEITESMAMNDPDVALGHIEVLKAKGVRFAIDDFGTGYSNLAQLSRLPFDVFKIDRSFVNALGGEDKNGDAIVRTIIAMAHSLQYETVAEGVETEDQLHALKQAGCRVMQGFFFARPMGVENLMEWLGTQVEKRNNKAA
ncbi:MAG: EAL domain-containing protein [Salaquimonas sp.]